MDERSYGTLEGFGEKLDFLNDPEHQTRLSIPISDFLRIGNNYLSYPHDCKLLLRLDHEPPYCAAMWCIEYCASLFALYIEIQA